MGTRRCLTRQFRQGFVTEVLAPYVVRSGEARKWGDRWPRVSGANGAGECLVVVHVSPHLSRALKEPHGTAENRLLLGTRTVFDPVTGTWS